jgi:hypothetical protein
MDQRLFFFGGVRLWELRGTFGRRIGIGEGGRTGEGGGIGEDFVPVLEFVVERKLLLHVRERREQDLAEVGESGGFAKGDTVLRDGDKELAKDVVNVRGG